MRFVHAFAALLVLMPGLLPALLPGSAAEMRREHPNLLKHRRDRTVREGVRGGDNALTACIDCHAGKAGGDVIGGPDAFCQSCHSYAAVKLDCFECHQSKREPEVATRSGG
jgi:hypothetical protein